MGRIDPYCSSENDKLCEVRAPLWSNYPRVILKIAVDIVRTDKFNISWSNPE